MFLRDQGLFSTAPAADEESDAKFPLTINVDLTPYANSEISPLSKPHDFEVSRYAELLIERDKYAAIAKSSVNPAEAYNASNYMLVYQHEIDAFKLKTDASLEMWIEKHFKTAIKCFFIGGISILHLPNSSEHAEALSIIPPADSRSGSIWVISIEKRKTLFLDLYRRYAYPPPIDNTPTSPRPK